METAEKKGRVAASVLQPGDSWPTPLDEELEEPPVARRADGLSREDGTGAAGS